MDEANLGVPSPPFGPGDCSSGILLHVTSLPSPYGIGDLGRSAFGWVGRLAWSAAAALVMAPLQDVLNLGSEARINRPGSPEGNWGWRVSGDMLSGPMFDRLGDLTEGSAVADVHRR